MKPSHFLIFYSFRQIPECGGIIELFQNGSRSMAVAAKTTEFLCTKPRRINMSKWRIVSYMIYTLTQYVHALNRTTDLL